MDDDGLYKLQDRDALLRRSLLLGRIKPLVTGAMTVAGMKLAGHNMRTSLFFGFSNTVFNYGAMIALTELFHARHLSLDETDKVFAMAEYGGSTILSGLATIPLSMYLFDGNQAIGIQQHLEIAGIASMSSIAPTVMTDVSMPINPLLYDKKGSRYVS